MVRKTTVFVSIITHDKDSVAIVASSSPAFTKLHPVVNTMHIMRIPHTVSHKGSFIRNFTAIIWTVV